jgi:GAF domain-containing protein
METSLGKYQAEIKMIVTLSSLINSSLDIQNVLDNALFCVEQFIDAEVSSIFEVDHEKGELFFRLTRGQDSEKIKKYRLKIGEGIAGWVAKTEKPLICSDPARDPRFCHRFDEQSGYRTSSIICVPIKCKDQLIGIVEVLNKKSGSVFDENDLEILTILGNQIGIALENARIYRHVKEKLSTTEKELGIIGEKLLRTERLAALGKFSQGVAHEVRNPVMVIGGFAATTKAYAFR